MFVKKQKDRERERASRERQRQFFKPKIHLQQCVRFNEGNRADEERRRKRETDMYTHPVAAQVLDVTRENCVPAELDRQIQERRREFRLKSSACKESIKGIKIKSEREKMGQSASPPVQLKNGRGESRGRLLIPAAMHFSQ